MSGFAMAEQTPDWTALCAGLQRPLLFHPASSALVMQRPGYERADWWVQCNVLLLL